MPEESKLDRIKNFVERNQTAITAVAVAVPSAILAGVLAKQLVLTAAHTMHTESKYISLIDAVRAGHTFKWDEASDTLWDLNIHPDRA